MATFLFVSFAFSIKKKKKNAKQAHKHQNIKKHQHYWYTHVAYLRMHFHDGPDKLPTFAHTPPFVSPTQNLQAEHIKTKDARHGLQHPTVRTHTHTKKKIEKNRKKSSGMWEKTPRKMPSSQNYPGRTLYAPWTTACSSPPRVHPDLTAAIPCPLFKQQQQKNRQVMTAKKARRDGTELELFKFSYIVLIFVGTATATS